MRITKTNRLTGRDVSGPSVTPSHLVLIMNWHHVTEQQEDSVWRTCPNSCSVQTAKAFGEKMINRLQYLSIIWQTAAPSALGDIRHVHPSAGSRTERGLLSGWRSSGIDPTSYINSSFHFLFFFFLSDHTGSTSHWGRNLQACQWASAPVIKPSTGVWPHAPWRTNPSRVCSVSGLRKRTRLSVSEISQKVCLKKYNNLLV